MLMESDDEKAIRILMAIVQLSKSGKPYKHFIPKLKKLLNNAPVARDLVNQLYKNLNYES